MKSIQNILQTDGIEFLDNLMNDYLVVYEKLNASTLSFRRIGNELKFYKGRDNEEITSLNETLYTYFKEGIDYLRRVSLIFYMEFPEGWMYKFQYFNPNSPGLVNYAQLPKNNLVLSCIDTGNSIIEDINVLKRWADRLQVDVDEPVFSGFLSEFQKEKLMDYANGNTNYENIPFSQYIISLLNPGVSHSAYSDSFNSGIDSFIFKFYKAGSKKCMPLKLVDPYMEELIKQNRDKFGTNSGTENEIILANFIAWLQTVDMKDIDVVGDTDDERYMDLLCKLFNKYAEKEQKLFKDLKTNVNESYNVDIDKIQNDETAKILKDNPTMTKAFQVIVGSFMNRKDNDLDPMSIMDDTLKDLFNQEVSSIKRLTSSKDDQVKSFTELMKSSMDGSNDEMKNDEKVLSFSELMDKIGYSESEEDKDHDLENVEPDSSKNSDENTDEKPKEENKKTEELNDSDNKSEQKEESSEKEPEIKEKTDNEKDSNHNIEHKNSDISKESDLKEGEEHETEESDENDRKDNNENVESKTDKSNEQEQSKDDDSNTKTDDNDKDIDKEKESESGESNESGETKHDENKDSKTENNKEKEEQVKQEDDRTMHEPKNAEKENDKEEQSKVDHEEREKNAPVASASKEKQEKETPEKPEKPKPEKPVKKEDDTITL